MIVKLDKDNNWQPTNFVVMTSSPENDRPRDGFLKRSKEEVEKVEKEFLDAGWQKTSPELSAILDKKYGLKKAKKESNKHVRNGKKDTTRQVQT